jgi:hypothetical protein
MKGSRKRNLRKWDNSEEYINSRKEKEFLIKYKNIAGEYLVDSELIDLFKRNNYDEELISKELNRIKLGDEFKWKEIKNGKPVTTRSTDQIRKKKNYYRPEKSYPSYDKYEKSEEETNESNNKRKNKGSYHKYYISKKPKRPFQKCIEVPSDYHPPNNEQEKQNNNNINNDNKIIENSEGENIIVKNNENFEKNIKKTYVMNKSEEKKNEEKNLSEEEQKKIILLKGKAFNSIKSLKAKTEIKKRETVQNMEKYNGKDINEDNNKSPGPQININEDLKRKELQKKYFRDFLGHMKHYSKKVDNNIKRANSKDSETSDDRSPESIKRRKKNSIPTSSNIIQKKKIISHNNNGINRNLRKAYEIEKNDIEFESEVANISINSCYDNPYRDQYLKIINEKRKKNPDKIVEFIIPQFNSPFMQPFPSPYQYNPYANQNMYMYPPQYQMQGSIGNQQLNPQMNMQLNPQINPQMNMQLNPQINPQMNMQLNPQINPQMNMQLNPQINQQIKYSANLQMNPQINSPINSPLNSQINLQMSPLINPKMSNDNNNLGANNPQLLSPQLNNAPNPELMNNNMSDS